MSDFTFALLKGLTISAAHVARGRGDHRVTFTLADGRELVMYHSQDCCESVYIDEVRGKLKNLIGKPITLAEEKIETGGTDDTWTKTTFTLATEDSEVTIYWHGSSNGYYSESVSFQEVR